MLILTDASHTQQITDPFIRQHCTMLFVECLSEDALFGFPYNPEEHGYIVIAEPGDTVAVLEQQSGIPILTDMVTGQRFCDPDFVPCFDILEAHHGTNGSIFTEMLVITTDSGFGICIIVPHVQGIDPSLLAFIDVFAKPALSATD